MKTKFKTVVQLIIVTIFISLTSCSEEAIVTKATHLSKLESKKGSIHDFKNASQFLQDFKINYVALNNNFAKTQSATIVIDTSLVLKMFANNVESYTYKVKTPFLTEGKYENLVLVKYDLVPLKGFLYTYDYDENYKNLYKLDPKTPFTGSVAIQELDPGFVVQGCTTVNTTICFIPDSDHPGVHESYCPGCQIISCTVTDCEDSPGAGETGSSSNNGGINFGSGSNSSGSSGNLNGGGGNNNIIANPTYNLPFLEASIYLVQDDLFKYQFLLNTLSLNQFQTEWLAYDPDKINMLFDFLTQDNTLENREILKNWITLKIKLSTNPNFLLNIPCAEIPKWQTLSQFVPPVSVKNKIQALDSQSMFTDYNIQYLDHAAGTAINLDYFPVTINTLPKNPATGVQFTPAQFLNYIRLNINSFVNTNISSFSPTTLNTGYNEAAIWNSANPLGAIIHIDIPAYGNTPSPGDGSVICSETNSNHWIYTTIEVPYSPSQGSDGIHPVSGNREFGLIQNSDGSYTFYTRGVDRMTDGFDQFMVNNLNMNPFENPDLLWNSLRAKVHDFVQNNSGISQPVSSTPHAIYRPDWAKVKDVLKGLRPMSDLGCN